MARFIIGNLSTEPTEEKPLIAPVLNFDPNQPRDEGGKWTDGGGGEWERRRDREEGTQAEADRDVKRAIHKRDKLKSKLEAAEAKVKASPNVKALEKRLAEIDARIAELKAMEKALAESRL